MPTCVCGATIMCCSCCGRRLPALTGDSTAPKTQRRARKSSQPLAAAAAEDEPWMKGLPPRPISGFDLFCIQHSPTPPSAQDGATQTSAFTDLTQIKRQFAQRWLLAEAPVRGLCEQRAIKWNLRFESTTSVAAAEPTPSAFTVDAGAVPPPPLDCSTVDSEKVQVAASPTSLQVQGASMTFVESEERGSARLPDVHASSSSSSVNYIGAAAAGGGGAPRFAVTKEVTSGRKRRSGGSTKSSYAIFASSTRTQYATRELQRMAWEAMTDLEKRPYDSRAAELRTRRYLASGQK